MQKRQCPDSRPPSREIQSKKFKSLTLHSGDTNKLVCDVVHMHVGTCIHLTHTGYMQTHSAPYTHAQLCFLKLFSFSI